MPQTNEEYDKIISICKSIFVKKMKDYGASWRIMRLPSLTDQIYIKAKRIRSIQELQEKKINEDESTEFIGIINYAIMALIQFEKGIAEQADLSKEQAGQLYNQQIELTMNLMRDKNHDYGEAWRDLRISSITDLILQKLLRIKQIESNHGKTIISEGIDANYRDIINYGVFALIHLQNSKT